MQIPDAILIYSVPCSQDGTSEELIGEWMELRGNRDQMVIATKVCLPTLLGHNKLN